MRAVAVTAAACASVLPAAARAQSLYDAVSLRAEGGIGTLFGAHQRDVLGYTQIDGWAAARIGALFWGPIGVYVSGVSGWFPSSTGLGQLLGLTGSLRFEPVIPNSPVRILFDLGAGPGWTGPYLRPMLEAGVGVEFNARGIPFAVGVMARYAHVFQDPADPFPADAQALFGVLHFAIRTPPRRTAPSAPPPLASERERDHDPQGGSGDLDDDGVIDLLDQCPDVPMGSLRDLRRLGCPRPDSDRDGVPDSDDNCPVTNPGPHPDPHHPGCPDPDGDGDGVVDRFDMCTEVPAGLFPDTERAGCPRADRDHDTLPDAMDHCPDRAGAPDRRAAHNGCPGAFEIVETVVRFTPPWTFTAGESAVPPNGHAALLVVASAVRTLPAARVLVRVAAVGTPSSLARSRSQAVVEWFRARRVDAAFDDVRPEQETAPDGTPVLRIVPAPIAAPPPPPP